MNKTRLSSKVNGGVRGLLAGCASILLLGTAASCSDATSVAPVEEGTNTEMGSVEMPLVVSSGDSIYRLSLNVQVYNYEYGYGYGIYSDAYSDETSIKREVPTGEYYSSLYDWQLYKEEDGEIYPVSSVLVSDYSTYFTIHNNATTTLSYTFETDGVRVAFGTGNLVVDVTVNEVDPACTPLGDSCGDGYWCPPPELTGTRLSCVYVQGARTVGESCSAPSDCGANLSCFDFGAGPVCGALCLQDDFDEACASGGTCVAQGRTYGVCVPEGGTAPETGGGFGGGFGGSSGVPTSPTSSIGPWPAPTSSGATGSTATSD